MELAQPLTAPQALPDGISLPVGLIANTAPSELSTAVTDARYAYVEAYSKADSGVMVDFLREEMGSRAADLRSSETDHQRVTAVLGELQTSLGAGEVVGYTPSAEILDTMMRLQDLAERTTTVVAEDEADAEQVRAEFERQSVERLQAELALADAQEAKDLADQVLTEQQALGRRGRLATAIGGTIVPTVAVGAMVFETPLSEHLNSAARLAVIAGTIVFYGIASYVTGSLLSDRFAYIRAKGLVAKAQKTGA